MARITSNIPQKGQSLPVGDRDAELIIMIEETECGRPFSFTLKGHHLQPKPGRTPPGPNNYDDWYTALTESEKTQLMQQVLAYYRQASADPDGLKTAAVGIVENADPDAALKEKHLIYVGFNTTTEKSDKNNPYVKNCAEINVISAGQQSTRRHLVHRLGKDDPENKEFLEFHVMGGRDANPNIPGDVGVPGVCPCGQCTDRLASEMVEGGKIYVYPYRNAEMQHEINHDADNFSQVGADQIWATTIDVLNRKRSVPLDAAQKKIQEDGLRWMAEQLVDYHPPEVSEDVIEQTVKNKRAHRKSIPELDVATHNGVLDMVALDHFLKHEILQDLAPRMERNHIAHNVDAILKWFEKIDTVRCCVVKTDDGCYNSALDSRVSSDKAFAPAESAALSAAIKSLGNHGVETLYPMTFSPKNIHDGVMRTVNKDGLERAYKRRTRVEGKEMSTCHLLLNNGDFGEKTKETIEGLAQEFTFDMPTIYPGGFAGTNDRSQMLKPTPPPVPTGEPGPWRRKHNQRPVTESTWNFIK